ncbi:uncharacterized protein LOC105165554 [Sesamum indicum]|uniref:Uncharacterized protein LOC105165554 n=1 Tax=Sesamum indicum TaxID=4182 RepID=A0A6I9TDB6_SESIN|nr:uncharacterized protein LOC105165554 [Sesamum indicum]
MEESHHLLRPLLNQSTTTAAPPPKDDHVVDNLKPISSNSSIILRLTLVACIGIVSIWANHEASKGYDITIVNESGDTFLGKRFELFYVSNDEAVRLVIRASKVVENFLYPDHDSHIKKPISHIIVKLADRNLTDDIFVESTTDHKFVLNISPSVMEGTSFRQVVFQAVKRGVARISLWDGRGNAPQNLKDGIVEYMIGHLWATRPPSGHDKAKPLRSAARCWKHADSRVVAEFLDYCERRRPGFIRRLNHAMMDGWDDGKLDGLLGQPAQTLCTTYESLRYNISSV